MRGEVVGSGSVPPSELQTTTSGIQDLEFEDSGTSSAAETPHMESNSADREYDPGVPPDSFWQEGRQPARPPARQRASEPAGRTMPHSLEAEEYLLACCLLDGAEAIGQCLRSRVGAGSFYDTKHRIVFEGLLHLYLKDAKAIDISVLAEELKTRRQLDEIGGYAFLAQVSGRIPTLAQLGYFIEKVREQAVLREIIRQSTAAVEDCFSYSGGLEELASELHRKVTKAIDLAHAPDELSLRPITSFELPLEDDPASLLGRNRYIGRGDGALIVSSSGMGKSVMCYEWPVLAALGRPFLGIETKRPLKSLLIQAEDADGDIGEVMFSLRYMLKLTDAETRAIRDNVIVVREKEHRGLTFINRLRILTSKVNPDLVWLNPLHAFAGCDIADAKEMGDFLRGGLNGINKDDRFAYMIVHHTPKPMTGKGAPDKKWHEMMYDAAGSAELVNWARAVITLKPTDTDGEFNLVLAKRGKRAGVRIVSPDSAAGTRIEITTKIPIKHSSERIKIEGRSELFDVLHWEMRAPDSQAPKAPKIKEGRPAKYFFENYRKAFLLHYSGVKKAANFTSLHRTAVAVDGISPTQLRDLVRASVESGNLAQAEDGRYYMDVPGL